MKYEFDSEIKQLEGKIKWSVFYFPYSTVKELGSKGNIPVLITVDGHSFEHTQPDYLKREQANYIEVAKKEETKQNRLNKLIAMLGERK